MQFSTALLMIALLSLTPHGPRSNPPVRNPALLNMGFVCKWQEVCIRKQQRAMKRSLSYLRAEVIPRWKIGVCNRNSARGGTRKDWIGFENCLRNPAIRPQTSKLRRR
jgi:hypothetical protein